MKKFLVLMLGICLLAGVARADRCVLNTEEITQSAFQELNRVESVAHYCPTCVGDNRVRYIKVSDVKVVKNGDTQEIQIGQERIDLAYIYLPTDKPNIYHNLGYVVHCAADLDKTPVLEYLDTERPYGIENIENLSAAVDGCETESCVEEVYQEILRDYFNHSDQTFLGFPYGIVPLSVVSKVEVHNLLKEISYYYGVDILGEE